MSQTLIPQLSRYVGYILALIWIGLGGIIYESASFEILSIYCLLSIAFGYWIYRLVKLNREMQTAMRAITANRNLIVKLMLKNYEGSNKEKIELFLEDVGEDLEDLLPEGQDPDLWLYSLHKDVKTYLKD
jgi:hypothetical protein